MLIENEKIEIKINGKNRNKYEEILNISLNNNSYILIEQKNVLESSRQHVKCECDNCHEIFYKRMVDVRKNTLCCKECRNEWVKNNNPNPPKKRIEVECEVCNTKIKVTPSKHKKQKHFLCSRKCYSLHRKKKYKGERIYNYQNKYIQCEQCNKEFKTSSWYLDSKNDLFCTQECYWKYRKENYTEKYYKNDLNSLRKETNPERKVRETLNAFGILFEQEKPFFKKYYADFYLPKTKSIIEVNGDYWHANPKYYGSESNKKPLNEMQKRSIKRDQDRLKDFEKYGFRVFFIWEDEINRNVELYLKKILDEIYDKKESATTARQAP